MNRRDFLAGCSVVASSSFIRSPMPAWAQQAAADVTLTIAPLNLEIAPGKTIRTIAYNGAVPGPLIRWPEGKPINIDVLNRTDAAEIVHWHGLWIPSEMDGSMEEGSPMISPQDRLRYSFMPRPSGFRWYHTHTYAGHNLKKAAYTGQFGCFYIEPKVNPGNCDQEIFLTLHDWNAYMSGSDDASMDVSYHYGTINGKMLGAGEPIRVKKGQRVLLHVVNASATLTHWLACSAHELQVVAMDGNPVPVQRNVRAIRLAPAERIDAVMEMNQPGIWILGETRDDARKAGMGIIVEYEHQQGEPRWLAPTEAQWDYTQFARRQRATEPDVRIPMIFRSKFRGHGDFDYWTINGKSFPKTDTIALQQGKRYRLIMQNESVDDHPVHLHRHTFEVTSLDGIAISGLMKDVLVIKAKSTAEIDFIAANPGMTLFHCHQQSHMDFGFMMLFRYA